MGFTPRQPAASPAFTPVALPPSQWGLPDPRLAPPGQELLGLGADLEPATMVAGYGGAVFPMGVDLPDGEHALGWWSPDPRGVLLPSKFHASRSLRRSARHFHVTFNTEFAQVVASCADPGRPHGWIDEEFQLAYRRLHKLGWAHSVEVWSDDGDLAGGLFGVQVGGLFAAESKFHRQRDASKVALMSLSSRMRDTKLPGRRLIDVQWSTEHLRTLGVRDMSREDYLAALAEIVATPALALDHPLAG
jgi:leucyl/phenylalanyl-tRNA---protein transferase